SGARLTPRWDQPVARRTRRCANARRARRPGRPRPAGPSDGAGRGLEVRLRRRREPRAALPVPWRIAGVARRVWRRRPERAPDRTRPAPCAPGALSSRWRDRDAGRVQPERLPSLSGAAGAVPPARAERIPPAERAVRALDPDPSRWGGRVDAATAVGR